MLRNIEIGNFGSYRNFNGFSDKNLFKKMNIFYGANYSGKTTLSRIIALLKNKDSPLNYNNPNFKVIFEDSYFDISNYRDCSKELLVFNKDFINDNLSFLVFNDHDKGSIKSFDAVIIGQDQIEINTKISDLNAANQMLQNVELGINIVLNLINNDKGTLNSKKLAIEREISSKLTEKARSLEASGLKNTARTYRKPNLESDIQDILRKNPQLDRKFSEDEILKKIKDMSVSEKPLINFINKEQEIDNYIKTHLLKAKEKLNEVVEKSVSKEINEFFKDWSIQGYHLHKEHDKEKCEFCGGDLSTTLLDEYEQFLNKREEILKIEINSLISDQQRINKALQAEIERFVEPDAYFYDSFISEYKESISVLKSKAYDFMEKLSLLESVLKEKLDKLSIKLEFDFSIIDKSKKIFLESYIEVVKICRKNDSFSNNLSEEQSKLKAEILEEKIVEFLIEFDWYKKNIEIDSFDKLISELDNPIIQNNDRLNEINVFKTIINAEIEKLNAQKSTQKAATDLVNKFLNSFFGHESLSLIPLEGESGQGKFKIVRNGHDAYNLSEGECTLVSFCYFIALVYNLRNIDKLKDNIVYIDDPISSLDSNNIFYIFSLIDNVICKEDGYKQLFISTHNLEFFKYLRKLQIPKIQVNIKSCSDPSCSSTKRNKSDDVGFYLIRKNNEVSEITVLPNYLRKYNTEFNYLFSQIWNCANETGELTPDQIYNFGNNMRKFFEVYNYFKYPTDHNKSSFRESFFDADNNLNYFNLIDRIANEYSHAEEIFDRTMKPISSQEMISVSKFILERLEENDSVQYSALVQSIRDLREDI